jgi:Acetyltransferase (GNAT) family
MIAKFFESIRFYFRVHGFAGGILFALGLIRSDIECIYISDLKKLGPDIQKYRNPQLRVIFVKTVEDFYPVLTDYEKIRGKILSLSDVETLKSGRDYLAMAYQGDVFVGWGWIKIGPIVYGNYPISTEDFLIHKCRTIREHRGKGVYTTILIEVQEEMAKMGFSKALIGAKSFNKSSIRGIEKTGFKFIKQCDLGSFCSRLFHHLKRKSPKVLQTNSG